MSVNRLLVAGAGQMGAGIVQVSAEEKAAAAKLAGMTSRINTMLSIPMLFCMVAQQNAGL